MSDYDDKLLKITDVMLESMTWDAALSMPITRDLALFNHPLTFEQASKVGKAVSEALSLALGEDGVLVKIGCDTPSEILIASETLIVMAEKLDREEARLDIANSNRARFEFTNNSAILLARK